MLPGLGGEARARSLHLGTGSTHVATLGRLRGGEGRGGEGWGTAEGWGGVGRGEGRLKVRGRQVSERSRGREGRASLGRTPPRAQPLGSFCKCCFY